MNKQITLYICICIPAGLSFHLQNLLMPIGCQGDSSCLATTQVHRDGEEIQGFPRTLEGGV